jgi:hypothetical protein
MEADVGSLQLSDAQNATLVFRHVIDPSVAMLNGLVVPITQQIDSRIFRTCLSEMTNKVRDGEEWNHSVDDQTGYHTESVLSTPMKRRGGELISVLPVLNGHPSDSSAPDREHTSTKQSSPYWNRCSSEH